MNNDNYSSRRAGADFAHGNDDGTPTLRAIPPAGAERIFINGHRERNRPMLKALRYLSVAALLFTGSAQATLGTLTSTTNVGDITSNANAFTRSVPAISGGGLSFVEVFNFSLSLPTALSAVGVGFGISNFDMLLSFVAPKSSFPGDPSVVSVSSLLNPGTYSLTLSGDVIGTAPGNYVLSLNALPVPEPAEWMLFASGLMLVGYMVRRRTNTLSGTPAA